MAAKASRTPPGSHRPATLVAALSVFAAIARGDGVSDPAVNAAYLVVHPDSVTLELAGSAQLKVTVFAADSTVIADAVPVFRSNAPSVVAVSSAGTVSSVGGVAGSSDRS